MTKPPRAPNAGVLATIASGASPPMHETPEVIRAQTAFAEALNLAEGRKQSAIAAAMQIKDVAAHTAAIRAAERRFHFDLAAAADASGGLIGSASYHAAASAA